MQAWDPYRGVGPSTHQSQELNKPLYFACHQASDTIKATKQTKAGVKVNLYIFSNCPINTFRKTILSLLKKV
jgi:hypothetical protein